MTNRCITCENTMVWKNVLVILVISISIAFQQESNLTCISLNDKSTWPKQLLEDFNICQKNSSEIKPEKLERKQRKNKEFMQAFWSDLIKKVSKDERIKILECLWTRQKIYDKENNKIDWDEVDSIIDNLKINSERKESIKSSIEKCIEDNDKDELYKIKKMAKCIIKEKCTIAACPELKRRQKDRPLCKRKRYKEVNNNTSINQNNSKSNDQKNNNDEENGNTNKDDKE